MKVIIILYTNSLMKAYKNLGFTYSFDSNIAYEDKQYTIKFVKNKICESTIISDIRTFVAYLQTDLTIISFVNWLYGNIEKNSTEEYYKYEKKEDVESGVIKVIHLTMSFKK